MQTSICTYCSFHPCFIVLHITQITELLHHLQHSSIHLQANSISFPIFFPLSHAGHWKFYTPLKFCGPKHLWWQNRNYYTPASLPVKGSHSIHTAILLLKCFLMLVCLLPSPSSYPCTFRSSVFHSILPTVEHIFGSSIYSSIFMKSLAYNNFHGTSPQAVITDSY